MEQLTSEKLLQELELAEWNIYQLLSSDVRLSTNAINNLTHERYLMKQCISYIKEREHKNIIYVDVKDVTKTEFNNKINLVRRAMMQVE